MTKNVCGLCAPLDIEFRFTFRTSGVIGTAPPDVANEKKKASVSKEETLLSLLEECWPEMSAEPRIVTPSEEPPTIVSRSVYTLSVRIFWLVLHPRCKSAH